MNWELKQLISLCDDVYSGGTPSTTNDSYYGGDIPWLRTQEVVFNRISDTEIKITEDGLKNSPAKWVPANSVIVAMYGNSAGRVALNEIALTTNQACCNLVINPEVADYRYVFYSLVKNYEALKGQAKGAAQNNLNASQVKFFEIVAPPLPTQTVIADILSSYDDLIINNQRRIELLEESARMLYKEWFVYFRFPGCEHVKIKDGIPEGWNRGFISDLGEVVTGKTPSKKIDANYGEDVLFIKTPDMHSNSFIFKTEEMLSEQGASTQKKKTLPVGSLLVSCIGTVGVVAMNALPAQTNQQINSIITKSLNLRYFGFFELERLKPRLEAIGGGATMANVNKTKFESISIIIPENAILDSFHDVVQESFNQIINLKQQNYCLANSRDILLPRLMNGTINV